MLSLRNRTFDTASGNTLYINSNQISAVSGTGPILMLQTTGTWTPADNSGAGLTFSSVNCKFTRHGNGVYCYGTLTTPVTASGSDFTVSGLPFTIPAGYGTLAGTVQMAGSFGGAVLSLVSGGTSFKVWNNASASYLTNAQMANKTIHLNLNYPLT